MIFTLLPHFLGVCCALYALQLLRNLGQDFRGKRFAPCFVAFLGGLVAVFLAVMLVLGVDYLYPVGSAATREAYFVRICFLVPLIYLGAFLSSLFVSTLIGQKRPATIVAHTAYLGVTLIVLAPMASIWFTSAAQTFARYL